MRECGCLDFCLFHRNDDTRQLPGFWLSWLEFRTRMESRLGNLFLDGVGMEHLHRLDADVHILT